MAANNLRIVYDNIVDYTTTTVTPSSTASSSLTGNNLKLDTKGLVWRTTAHSTSFSVPAYFKNTTSYTTTGLHSSLRVTSSPSAGGATLYYTITAAGGTEAGNTTALPNTFNISNTATASSYVVRVYTGTTTSSTMVDMQTIPVILSSSNTLTAVLSNAWHRIPGDTTASGVLTGTGTNLFVFDGPTPLRYVAGASGPGTFSFTVSGTGITPGATSTAGAPYATISDHTSLTAATATVVYSITARNFANTSTSISVTQTCTLTGVVGTTWYNTVFDPSIARAVLQIGSIPSGLSPVGAVVLTNTNIEAGGTMRVLGYNATPSQTGTVVDMPYWFSSTTRAFDTGHQNCVPYTSNSAPSYFSTIYNTNTYGMNKQTARIYVPPAIQTGTLTNIIIEIVDYGNTDNYIEASRLIMGRYWSPTYNTEYGLSASFIDTSETNRSEAGDLITTLGVVYKTMNFNLNFLTKTDRDELVRLLRQRGKRRPLFVSLFPENSDDWEKESLYQMYCKLSDTVPISHPYFEFFSSSLALEEV